MARRDQFWQGGHVPVRRGRVCSGAVWQGGRGVLSQGEVRRGLVRLGGHVPVRRGRVWSGAVWHGKAVQGGQANKQVVGCSGPLHKHKKLFGGQ